MKFEQIVEKVREKSKLIDATKTDFLAVMVTLTGKDGGVFYVEIKDHKVNVEPYEYNDRNCEIVMSTDNFLKFIDGKLNPVTAYTLGKLKVNGDLGKALEFSKLINKED